jgi:hypothetical protein
MSTRLLGTSLALAALLATSGCDALEKLKAKKHHKPTPTAQSATPQPIDAGHCADGWTVSLDEDSFAPANLNAARLDAFVTDAARSAALAADNACLDGKLDPAKAGAVKTVTLASTDDKGQPLFRLDGDAIRVEWDFARRDLTIPSEMEWRAGLICSIDPDSEECPHESAAQ